MMKIDQTMKKMFRYAGMAAVAALLLTGCDKTPGTGPNPNEKNYSKVNYYMGTLMYSYYLWADRLPASINVPSTDPYAFFDKLTVSEDNWSMLTDDVDSLIGNMTNESTSFGYSLTFFNFTDIKEIWAQVLYVHPGTPADKAGIKRGDFISRINGKPMTQDGSATDYRNLYYATSVDMTVNYSITDKKGREVSLTASNMYLDPIIESKVIDAGGTKVGYLFYSDYIRASENDLRRVFAGFKSQGVTELILDLRYNGGGTTTTSLLLSSLIVPKANLDGKTLFVKDTYNSKYTAYLQQEGLLEKYTHTYFPKAVEVPENLGLGTVYILTTGNTASASEQTIIGLSPYMDVITIGTDTHGKFVGGTIMPSKVENGKMVPDKSTDMGSWAMYIMTFMYENSEGQPGRNAGLVPTYKVEEDWRVFLPVGDEDDPLIAKALSLITGEPLKQQAVPSTRAAIDAVPVATFVPGIPTGVLIKNDGVFDM